MGIWKLLGTLLLIILIIVIGSGVLYEEKFKILEGTFNANASSVGSTTISYPEGYNKNNTAIISCGLKLNGGSRHYAYGYTTETTLAMAFAINDKYIVLTDDGINLSYKNDASSEKAFDYKIVLMKTN